MKKVLALMVVALVTFGVTTAFAGEGCCAGMKGADKGAACGEMFSKLKLTDEQKAKVTMLQDNCRRATSTSEHRRMFSAGLERILTAEQLAQWQTNCDKPMKTGECPYTSGAKKS